MKSSKARMNTFEKLVVSAILVIAPIIALLISLPATHYANWLFYLPEFYPSIGFAAFVEIMLLAMLFGLVLPLMRRNPLPTPPPRKWKPIKGVVVDLHR